MFIPLLNLLRRVVGKPNVYPHNYSLSKVNKKHWPEDLHTVVASGVNPAFISWDKDAKEWCINLDNFSPAEAMQLATELAKASEEKEVKQGSTKKRSKDVEYKWASIKDHFLILHLRVPTYRFFKQLSGISDYEPKFKAIDTAQGSFNIAVEGVRPIRTVMNMGIASIMYSEERPFSIGFEVGECFDIDKTKERVLSFLGINTKPIDPIDLETIYNLPEGKNNDNNEKPT